MHKRFLALSLILVIACASYVLAARHLIERDNLTVSFLMDGPDILAHAMALDINPQDYLIALRDAGLLGLVVPYEMTDIRDLASGSGLAVVLLFDGEPVREYPQLYDLSGVAGIAFHNSDTTNGFLDELDLRGELLFLIQRNDTFQGYLPSPVHAELIKDRYPAVRTYRISRLETDAPEYHPANMIQRWLINIREYNTRAIYARPYFDGGMIKNLDYVAGVAQELADAGFRLGPAEPMQVFFPARSAVAVLVVAALLITVLLAATFGLPAPLLTLGAGGAALIALLSLWSVSALPARLLAALSGAVSAGVLGIIWVFGPSGRRCHFAVAFLLVNLITLSLALGVAAILSDTDFFLEYQVFRGVKIQYTAPLLILAVYLALKMARDGDFRRMSRIAPHIRWLLAMVAVAIAIFYLYRSGDVDSISGVEAGVRAWLERMFVARPRFKELLTHPALMLSLYWRKRISPLLFAGGLLIGAMGQVSIVNTFLHLRTPLVLSLIRTGHGLWLGTLFGVLAIIATVWFARVIGRDGGHTK